MDHGTLSAAILVILPFGLGACATGSDRVETSPDSSPGRVERSGDEVHVHVGEGEQGGSSNASSSSASRRGPTESRYITTLGLPEGQAVYLPEWASNPSLGGVLGAVGMASVNDLGTNRQVDEARTTARLEISNVLETRIQRVGRADIEQYLTVLGGGDDASSQSQKGNLDVQRTITDVVLSGSRQRAMWFNPANGDCYVWIVMDGGVRQKVDHSIENGVSIFEASEIIKSEYQPRTRPEPQPAAPAPAPVLEPIEKLENNLKPIQTIPIGREEGSDSSDASLPLDPRLQDELNGLS